MIFNKQRKLTNQPSWTHIFCLWM